MRLIVGLGNPDERYTFSRHNIGAQVLKRAAARWSIDLRPRQGARSGRGRVGSAEVALSASLTWMNQTGPAVKALLADLALSPEDLVVIHDDLDLELGRLRIKRDGGSGGHNGILSILTALETNEFVRLKIGIGRPAPGQDAAEYVLSPFLPEEFPLLDESLDRAVVALECLLAEGVTVAMNRFNVRSQEEQDERESGEQG
ncbi:MAG: aminoacyl-tRNA hydrolase [Nitrospiraceae bacterium]